MTKIPLATLSSPLQTRNLSVRALSLSLSLFLRGMTDSGAARLWGQQCRVEAGWPRAGLGGAAAVHAAGPSRKAQQELRSRTTERRADGAKGYGGGARGRAELRGARDRARTEGIAGGRRRAGWWWRECRRHAGWMHGDGALRGRRAERQWCQRVELGHGVLVVPAATEAGAGWRSGGRAKLPRA
jgi:hypothetical protein